MAIDCNVNYQANAWLGTRFINHFALGVKEDIGSHNKNVMEKMGDLGLWMVEKFPGKVWNLMKDPRVVTVALTGFALLAASAAFYPTATYLGIKAGLALLPAIPAASVRLTAYICTVGLIISTALRAEGRFINSELMDRFYQRPALQDLEMNDDLAV